MGGPEERGLRARLDPVTQCAQGPRPVSLSSACHSHCRRPRPEPHSVPAPCTGCLERGRLSARPPETLPGEELRSWEPIVSSSGGLCKRTKFCTVIFAGKARHAAAGEGPASLQSLKNRLHDRPDRSPRSGCSPLMISISHWASRPDAFIHRQCSRTHSARGCVPPERPRPPLASLWLHPALLPLQIY